MKTKIKSYRKMSRAFAALVALVTLLAGAAANSTTLTRMSVAQMTEAAQLVVRVRCVSNSPHGMPVRSGPSPLSPSRKRGKARSPRI